MAKYFHSDTNARTGITTPLMFMQFMEKDVYILHCPALDLSGYGTTIEEAESSFAISLEFYLEHTSEHTSLRADLEKLGWKEELGIWTPPSLETALQHNSE